MFNRWESNTSSCRWKQYNTLSTTISGSSNRISSLTKNSTGQSIDYDANGNMIVHGLQGITAASYDWRNLPTSLDKGSDSFTFIYDGDGQRVKKSVSGGTTTYYVHGAMGKTIAVYDDSGSLLVKNILSGGEAIGKIDASGNRSYYLKDHLGSVRVTVNESGSPVGYDDYYPFGSVMDGRSNNSGNGNDLYKFTGHELDQEAGIGLIYAGARYLDPELGRWLSVDPLAGDYPAWSPYNYTMNNPLSLIDPDGKSAQSFAVHFVPCGGSTACIVIDPGDTMQDILDFIDKHNLGEVTLTDDNFNEDGSLKEGSSIRTNKSLLDIANKGYPGAVGVPGQSINISIDYRFMLIALGVVAGGYVYDQVTVDDGFTYSNTQDKKLTDGEIKKLKDKGVDPEELKGGKRTGKLDLYKKPNGNIVIKPKSGRGPGEPTGLNINDF